MMLGAAVDDAVVELQKALEALAVGAGRRQAVARVAADTAAGRFHLSDGRFPPPVVVLGGTGTGKSTIINRVLGTNVCAASFRRTFTTGAVAVADSAGQVPPGWLGIARRMAGAADLPVCGAGDVLTIAPVDPATSVEHRALIERITLVDSPDLDGDRPDHHAQADRAFRWARAVVFVVTPEKYQMTELLPYYRLARRYALPALFVMNKCEESAVVEDYAAQLAGRDWRDAALFVIPRDDAAYEPPAESNLSSLRTKMEGLVAARSDVAGLANRMRDLVARATDQVLVPLREDRAAVDRLAGILREMAAPSPGVDVSPVTAAVQRRFHQRSVLYLMGPQRMLERLQQLKRLPRGVIDTLFRGQKPTLPEPEALKSQTVDPPDFGQVLAEQFQVFHSRLDDPLRSDPAARKWIDAGDESYKAAFLPVARASEIATDELGQLRQWVESNWNATPRDTALLMKGLKHLPGGAKLVKLFEVSPYLACVIADFFTVGGTTPSLVIANILFGTWLGEKITNEVKTRTRETNRRIIRRFNELAAAQVERTLEWLEKQAPSAADLKNLEKRINRLAEAIPRDKSGGAA